MVFVTHDLDEAVFLADRIVVLASRPGRVHAIVANPLARPRIEATRVSDEFTAAKRARMVIAAGGATSECATQLRGGGNA